MIIVYILPTLFPHYLRPDVFFSFSVLRKVPACMVTCLHSSLIALSTLSVIIGQTAWAANFHHPGKIPHRLSRSPGGDGSSGTWQAYRLPRPVTTSQLTHLPVLSNGDSALISNANNFHGSWHSSVNPRTGNVSFSLVVASMLYHHGYLKQDLVLSYAGTPSPDGPDFFDMGPSWRWNTGLEKPAAEVGGHMVTNIITGDGHAFTMVSIRDNRGRTVWEPLRHKLKDVKIAGHPGDWMISTASGAREHIFDGYEQWMESADGKRLYFYYSLQKKSTYIRHLTYICSHRLTSMEQRTSYNSCKKDGIWITYQGQNIIVHGNRTVILHRSAENGIYHLSSIIMPSLSSWQPPKVKDTGDFSSSADFLRSKSDFLRSKYNASIIFFDYNSRGHQPWLLHKVRYPTGLTDTFLYNNQSSHSGAQIHGLPVGFFRAFLPVVTEQITDSGNAEEPAQHVYYRYGSMAGGEQHNYMGYEGRGSIEPGKDNLFDRASSYTYSVTQDNGLTSTVTTYNKYHLPVKIEQWDNQRRSLLNTSDQFYPPWRNTVFSELPSNYSMVKKNIQTLYTIAAKKKDKILYASKIVQESRYNQAGQIIWQKDALGREKFMQYCPPEGDRHCPAISSELPAVGKLEKVIVLPALLPGETTLETAGLTVKETVFDYRAFPGSNSESADNFSNATVIGGMKKKQSVNGAVSGFFPLIKSKDIGFIPVSQMHNINPGEVLPELNDKNIINHTDYHYDTQRNSITYGQLTAMNMTRYSDSDNSGRGNNLLKLAFSEKTDFKENSAISINTDINMENNIKTTTLLINHGEEKRSKNRLPAMERLSDFTLGTSTYSLDTGVKLSSSDPLGEIKTTWIYDSWNRPVKKIVVPKNGGFIKTTKVFYTVTPEENSITVTLPGGQQIKKIYTGTGKVLSTWHKFSEESGKPAVGVNQWIQDEENHWTAFGKLAAHTVWHADDPEISGLPGKAIALTTTYGYDVLNRKVWTRYPNGRMGFTVRDDAGMQVIFYQASLTKSGKIILWPTFTVQRSNILGDVLESYLLPLDDSATKNHQNIYSPALQKKLLILKSYLQSMKSPCAQNSVGLLSVSGDNGLISFVNKSIHEHAWLNHSSRRYDGFGRVISQTKSNNSVTRWQYDRGDPAITIAPDGRIIHDLFNLRGEKTARFLQPGKDVRYHLMGTRGFDETGNLLWEKDQYGRRLDFRYDDNGRRVSVTYPPEAGAPEGHRITYRYNSLGLIEKDIDGVPCVKYIYDPVTWKLMDCFDGISHIHYSYDKYAELLLRESHDAPDLSAGVPVIHGINYPCWVKNITYDRYEHVIKYNDSGNNIYAFRHDLTGRITQRLITLPDKREKTLNRTVYDDFGRIYIVQNGIGIKRKFIYNNLGMLASTEDTMSSGKPVTTLSYAWDYDTGNLTAFTRTDNRGSATQKYTYDSTVNNLTGMVCSETGHPRTPSILCPRDIDIKNSGLNVPPVIISQEYTFDKWNNVKTITEEAISEKNRHVTKKTKYMYAASGNSFHQYWYDPGRLIAYQTQWNTQQYSTQPGAITYDESGRIIKDADGNQLRYDIFGQQNMFVNAETHEITKYYYNSAGQQVAEQPFNNKNQALQPPLYLLYDGNKFVGKSQKDGKGQLHSALQMSSAAYGKDGHIDAWYEHSYKGDVIGLFDNNGIQRAEKIYSPYGMSFDLKDTHAQGLSASLHLEAQQRWLELNDLGFNGQRADPATGYQFSGNGYRAYNPVYRQFMTRDSWSPFKVIDAYGFGLNNPVMNSDPSGHLPQWLGYTLGFSLIPVAITGALLAPVLFAALGFGSAPVSAATVAGAVFGLSNLISGSLQISSAARPDNAALGVINGAFGLINSALTSAFGFSTLLVVGSVDPAILSFMENGCQFASGIPDIFGGAFNIVTSAVEIHQALHPEIRDLDPLQRLALAAGLMTLGISVISSISRGTFLLKRLHKHLSSGSGSVTIRDLRTMPVPTDSPPAVLLQEETPSNESVSRPSRLRARRSSVGSALPPIPEDRRRVRFGSLDGGNAGIGRQVSVMIEMHPLHIRAVAEPSPPQLSSPSSLLPSPPSPELLWYRSPSEEDISSGGWSSSSGRQRESETWL